MSAVIQPFNKDEPVPKNTIASLRGVQAYMSRWLSRFKIRGDGIDIKQKDDGTIIFKAQPSVSSIAPFTVAISGGLVAVHPGFVYAAQSFTSPFFVPFMDGARLDAVPAPRLTVASGFTGYIVLRMEFAKESGLPKNLDWSIRAVATPLNTRLQRVGGALDPQDAEIDLPLARIVDGAVSVQGVTRSISVFSSWNTIVASF